MSNVAVDFVFTWVDGSDKSWRSSFDACLQNLSGLRGCNLRNTGSGRFRDREELRYSLRSIAKYARFFRHIYIVTDKQKPAWLNLSHPQISIVDHDDILPSNVSRPCFNSNVIQSYLHRIKGLSERFIVFDDDIMFSSTSSYKDFFSSENKIIFYRDRRVFDYSALSFHYWLDRYFFSGVLSSSCYTRDIFKKKLNIGYRHLLMHTPHAMTKDLMLRVHELFISEILLNNSHQFRRGDDLKVTCALLQYYAYYKDEAIMRDGCTYMDYIPLTWFPLSFLLTPLHINSYLRKSSRRLFVSVNDSTPSDNSKSTFRAVKKFFKTLFPQKSEFEL